ncbi:o-succinylbenzoate--CoA ligase [Rubrobacter marinus]|uniref:O-succinylbenzoate--CoA ligase n=1 Tax=Rubrobacter marinus TaxID=2653852 RepID=A0A6G8Q0E1_9ACTN|nr:o-succinylbenzoate--CoA ligase [Rubrobacter marinus]QIN79932.1 o-succinylbenzoate--CoA ligase [Rubrobacter marinus]
MKRRPEGPTIPCALRESALAAPDAPAILGPAGTITYAELDGRVSAAAGRLADAGCTPGARVALRMEKDERYVVLLLAALRAGCVVCPVSTRVPPEGVPALLRVARPSALVSDVELPIPETKGLAVMGPEGLDPGETEGARPGEHILVPTDRPATIVFTSGSTGTPKAALHTVGNHHYSALGSGENIPLGPGDRWLHSLPLYHVGGLSIVFRCLLAGAAMSFPEPDVPLGESLAQSGATHVSLVATQLRRLLSEEASLGALRAILLGGGPVPEALVDEALELGLPIHTSYGLTETSSQATTTPPGASREVLRTSGRALPYREVAVAGDGEILVRGETLFAGYVEGDGLDRRVDEAGWFHTKDLGELDSGGYLRVRGRKDNLFVSGGENVQPEEIEEALYRIEGVEGAVVVPVPDEEFGERPVAFVRAGDGRPLESLAQALEPVLPRFKIPVAFHPWPERPGPEGMKVDRAGFRALARRQGEP